MACEGAGKKRRHGLQSDDKADHDRAVAEMFMHIDRQGRKRQSDCGVTEKDDEDKGRKMKKRATGGTVGLDCFLSSRRHGNLLF
jgi:hypothetical protein